MCRPPPGTGNGPMGLRLGRNDNHRRRRRVQLRASESNSLYREVFVSPFHFFSELRRRRVMRVAGVYAVAAWAAVEVSATVFPLLTLPEWTVRLVLVLALIGFPVTFALAWVFDVTPDGVRRTLPVTELPPAPVVTVPAAPRQMSSRAAGFFGLGILVALVGFAAYARFGPPPAAARIQSIAVLPFADLSENRNQEYFSDGVTEELLNRLARIDGLHVAARTSSFAFKDHNEDMRQIGRKLQVQAVLEGSIRRDGNRLRIAAKLIDTRTGYQLWSETYERQLESVFAIQDEIANAIVAELRMQFSADAERDPAGTTNMRAHDAYLLGLARLHARTDGSVREALGYFDRAIAEDTAYALAYAALAQAYAVLPTLGDFPFAEAVEKGSAAAAQALALDARLAQAHAALGQLAQNFEWELGDAERAYRRAVEFKPGYATGHQWYAETLLLLGRISEAREAIERAVELDPLSPSVLNVRGYVRLVSGDVPGALEVYRALASTHPDYALGQLNLTLTAMLAGDYVLADAAAGRASSDATVVTAVRTVIAGLARPDARTAAVQAVERLDSTVPPAFAALWYAALGDVERALARLEQSQQLHADANLPMVLVHPLFRPLRDDARFRAITDAIGIATR